jgi:glycogen operon protein
MLLAGDELGHSQKGNNNCYCQDNELTWLNWELGPQQKEFLEFVKRVVKIWREQPVLQRRRFFQGRSIRGQGIKDLTWLQPNGKEMDDEAWNAGYIQCLGVLLAGNQIGEVDERGERIVGDTLLLLFNAYHEKVPFKLPPLGPDHRWEMLLDTAAPKRESVLGDGGETHDLEGRSIATFRLVKPGKGQ